MRRLSYIFLGTLIGIALTAAGGAYAASSGLIGKKITGEVAIVLNGQQVAERGSVAEGTTLLPVRSMAELFGVTTEYKDGKVYLTKEEGDSRMTDTQNHTPTHTDNTGAQEPEGPQTQKPDQSVIQKDINNLNKTIEVFKYSLENDPLSKEGKENVTKSIQELEQQKADLEAQLQALKS